MSALVYTFLFIAGTTIGSFLNVVATRYKPNRFLLDIRSLGGRSYCPKCKTQLSWYELVPIVSFFAQITRCRHCAKPISWQYPIVEVMSGLIFVAVPAYFESTYRVVELAVLGHDITWFYALSTIWIFAFLALLLLSVIDFYQYLIPNELTLFLAILGIGATYFAHGSFVGFYAPLLEISANPWISHFFSALVALLFFALIISVTRGRGMGIGDLKLAAALGLLFGWPDILLIGMTAFVVGSLASMRLLLAKRKTLADAVPFGPFLALSAGIVFFFGTQIVRAYFTLFGL